MSILEKINTPEDLKQLDINQMNELSSDIRQFLIDNVLTTGGHLASNLGVVELTLALHKVFDFSYDRIVFDVGHQSYVHKILTGRKNAFHTLRQLNGLSGFPKRSESIYDAFDAGHASTSISAAIGLARARDINNEKRNIVAFLGDGALTGGMTFEALNDIGQRKSGVIIVLNDNEMSIGKNVGGLSAHLAKLHVNPKYMNTKSAISEFLGKHGKAGANVSNFLESVRDKLKLAAVAAPYFESIGIKYIGIIDGHNIEELTKIFEQVKDTNEPILIHTLTKKGCGYKDAEENPDRYHGVSALCDSKKSFDLKYSDDFGEILCSLAMNNPKITAISAAMISGCGLSKFYKNFPDRTFDVGIAEEHAVTMAAGLAAGGLTPFVCIYSTFLQRAYDQIIHDVCMQNLHVVFAIDRAGIVGDDGETHQGIFDLSFLSHIPNMTILTPSCHSELVQMMDYAANECTGPVAIRYPKGSVSSRISEEKFSVSKAEIITNGSDTAIFTCGKMTDAALNAALNLEQVGISCSVINLRTVKPIDTECVESICKTTKTIFTLEDNINVGGVGDIVTSIANNCGAKCVKLGFPCEFIRHGKQDELFDIYSLTSDKISHIIKEELK